MEDTMPEVKVDLFTLVPILSLAAMAVEISEGGMINLPPNRSVEWGLKVRNALDSLAELEETPGFVGVIALPVDNRNFRERRKQALKSE
jgi:hypothetical protein